jgi:hypothetical protein
MTQKQALDEAKTRKIKPTKTQPPEKRHDGGAGTGAPALVRLQKQVGNRAVQRLIAQRSADGSFELDDDTAGRINRERGGGQPLDGTVQKQMGESMGHDFSGVRVHTGSESDALNEQLSARAFTTGQDIFVRSGDYNPASSSGQELLAHELAHVVQQGTGRVSGGGGGMTVRPPGDSFEQQADSTSRAFSAGAPVQRQNEEGLQEMSLQRQNEEELQEMPLQRQNEEELQEMPLQRQDEDELQEMPLQRQDEDELQEMPLQRQNEDELTEET